MIISHVQQWYMTTGYLLIFTDNPKAGTVECLCQGVFLDKQASCNELSCERKQKQWDG